MELLFGYKPQTLDEMSGLVTAKEILQQPMLWQEAYRSLKNKKQEIEAFTNKVLAEKGLRIILTGAGSSAFVGECTAPYLSRQLGRPVEAIATTDIVSNPLNYLIPDTPTLLVSFARSGNSPESIAAIDIADKLLGQVCHVILTCNSEGELAVRCRSRNDSLLLLMPELSNDKGFAMTGSFTTMVLSALLLFDIPSLEQQEELIDTICKTGRSFLENGYEQIKVLSEKTFSRLIYLGSGSLKGLARESALKMLELSAGEVMTSHDSTLAFRHGPKSVINEDTLTICYLSNEPYTRQYDIDLMREIHREKDGNTIIAVSGKRDEELESLADVTVSLEGLYEVKDEFLVLNFVLVAQTLALLKSLKLGISPDNPSPDGTVNRVVQGVNIYSFKI